MLEILKTKDVSVRKMKLLPHTKSEWHFHSEVEDFVFPLDGELFLCQKEPATEQYLCLGQHGKVNSQCVHRVENRTNKVVHYLLVQGIVQLDFNKYSPKTK